MSQIKCPSGHDSTDSDFCSECGTAIAADASAAVQQPATSGTVEKCPKCTTERDDPRAQFCGVCAYDFVNKVGGDAVVVPPPVTTVSPSQPATAAPVAPSGARVDIEVVVNGGSPLKFSLFDEESLVGRKSGSVAQSVGIPGDDGISRRQFMITRGNGSYTIRDLGSANGTKVNGTALADGEERPLSEGDVIEVGEFTRITVTTIRHS
jgi:hypothetical protein